VELEEFRLAQKRLDHLERLGRREVEDRPWHGRDRDPVLHGDLVGRQRFVVPPNPVPGSALDLIGDVDDRP